MNRENTSLIRSSRPALCNSRKALASVSNICRNGQRSVHRCVRVMGRTATTLAADRSCVRRCEPAVPTERIHHETV